MPLNSLPRAEGIRSRLHVVATCPAEEGGRGERHAARPAIRDGPNGPPAIGEEANASPPQPSEMKRIQASLKLCTYVRDQS
jgi:hypothetical protein